MVDAVSPMTGEHAFFVQLMLASAAPCSLRGYPTVTFGTGRGKPVPFRVVDGKGPYVTHRQPPRLNLDGAGDRVFVEVAKYRCDVSSSATARLATLQLPGVRRAVVVHFGHITSFDYCSEPASQLVYVSPVLGDERQLF